MAGGGRPARGDHDLTNSCGWPAVCNGPRSICPISPPTSFPMLFGEGQGDVAHFAASFPLAHTPDSQFCYSSGTTNIVSRLVADAIGPHVGSGLPRLHAGTAVRPARHDERRPALRRSRDFHRLVLLLLHPARLRQVRSAVPSRRGLGRPTSARARDVGRLRADPLGNGPRRCEPLWRALVGRLAAGPGSFSANGFEGQYIVCCPRPRPDHRAERRHPRVETAGEGLVARRSRRRFRSL